MLMVSMALATVKATVEQRALDFDEQGKGIGQDTTQTPKPYPK